MVGVVAVVVFVVVVVVVVVVSVVVIFVVNNLFVSSGPSRYRHDRDQRGLQSAKQSLLLFRTAIIAGVLLYLSIEA